MRAILFLLIISLSVSLSAQDLGKGWKNDKLGQEKFVVAEELFYNQNFLNALEIYRELEVKYPDADILKFRIGVCLLHKTDEVDQSVTYLEAVKAKNPKAEDIDYYIACAYHLTRQYDKALASIDIVLANKKVTPETKAKAERLRQYCNNAIELEKDPVNVTIRNVGGPVNTGASEYVPVVTSDDSAMFYTYVGEKSVGGLQSYPGIIDSGGIYFEDIYWSKRVNNDWQKPEPVGNQINTVGHDAAVGLSNDGQTLIVYKDEAGGGDLYLSHLEGNQWSVPEPIQGEVNTGAWEGHATFSADMRVMYFASERSGGYGGRDIWMAVLGEDGRWGNVRNMGPKINTAENEDAPFLHPNGLILMFSSEAHNSMGGYDIFQTELTPKDSLWAEPGEAQNIGYPVNTPGDDKYFVLALDGKHGYYSTSVTGGKGQQDIYVISGDLRVKNPRICQLTGLVTLDSVPMKSVITVRDDAGQLRTFYLESNSESGKYLVNLPAGRAYTISCEMMGTERKVAKLDAENAENMTRSTRDFHFFSPSYLARLRSDSARKDSLPIVTAPVTPLNATDVAKDSATTTATVRKPVEPSDYNTILADYGNAKAEGMYFRVQIAAYNFPNNYRYTNLSAIGTIDRTVLDDGITRFTMGKFETLAEAEAFRQRIVAAGQTDAFVTAERNGKRYLLRELVDLNFFQPK